MRLQSRPVFRATGQRLATALTTPRTNRWRAEIARIGPSGFTATLGLDNYPVIDEEAMSEVEREAEDEDWDNWTRHDYERALVSALNDDGKYATDEAHEFREGCQCRDCLEEAIDGMEDLRSVFEEVASRINVYWVNETGNSATVNVDRIVAATTLVDLGMKSGDSGATTMPAEGGK